jgi:hypothetical protein
VSRGLGQVQLKILAILARYEADGDERLRGLLVEEIARRFRPSRAMSAAGRSSIRRALVNMRSAGLVQTRHWRPHDQGRPKLWKITNGGMTEAKRRRIRLG